MQTQTKEQKAEELLTTLDRPECDEILDVIRSQDEAYIEDIRDVVGLQMKDIQDVLSTLQHHGLVLEIESQYGTKYRLNRSRLQQIAGALKDMNVNYEKHY